MDENLLKSGAANQASGRGGGKRDAILAAALKVFNEHGYSAATVDAVAAEAGVAKGSVYNYFRGKEDLFRQVFAEAVMTAERDVGGLADDIGPASRHLERLLDYWYERLGYFRQIGRLVLEFWTTAAREAQHGELTAVLIEVYARWRERIASILAQGAQAGEFSKEFNSPVAAALIMGILDGIQVESILGIGMNVDKEFLGSLKRAIMLALTAGTANRGVTEGKAS